MDLKLNSFKKNNKNSYKVNTKSNHKNFYYSKSEAKRS